jgi:hypothetical protein
MLELRIVRTVAHPAFCKMGTGVHFTGLKRPSREAEHHPVQRLRMGEVIHPLPHVSLWCYDYGQERFHLQYNMSSQEGRNSASNNKIVAVILSYHINLRGESDRRMGKIHIEEFHNEHSWPDINRVKKMSRTGETRWGNEK